MSEGSFSAGADEAAYTRHSAFDSDRQEIGTQTTYLRVTPGCCDVFTAMSQSGADTCRTVWYGKVWHSSSERVRYFTERVRNVSSD